jgi:tartrate dehydratase beta subunit/fumarate hydratase class I family protein
MAKILKVPCTGKERHINEVNLDDILGSDVVLYGGPIVTGRDVPARIVRRCDVCDTGKVIITREMIEASL